MAALAAALAVPAQAQPYQAFPADEGIEVPEFLAWRDGLIDAVGRRDTEAVVALAHPDIQLSFGGAHGRDELRRWLNGVDDAPWTGEVYWKELETALNLGGTWRVYDDGSRDFCAPYTFTAELPVELSAFEVVMVILGDAPLYAGPSSKQPVIATLNYDIAEITDASRFDPDHPLLPYWLGIRTVDGAHEGYINSSAVRSPVDYRACFSEADGGWSWTLFVAGD